MWLHLLCKVIFICLKAFTIQHLNVSAAFSTVKPNIKPLPDGNWPYHLPTSKHQNCSLMCTVASLQAITAQVMGLDFFNNSFE